MKIIYFYICLRFFNVNSIQIIKKERKIRIYLLIVLYFLILSIVYIFFKFLLMFLKLINYNYNILYIFNNLFFLLFNYIILL